MHRGCTYLFAAEARRQRPLLAGPANNGLRIPLRAAFQGDSGAFGDVLLGRREGPNGGRELHVEGVFELYGRVDVEEAEEGSGVAGSGVGYDESRPVDADSSVPRHFLVAHRQQPLLAPVRRELLDDELVASLKEGC